MRSSGRNANLKEKIIITAKKLNHNNWRVIKHTDSVMLIKHKTTNSERELKVS